MRKRLGVHEVVSAAHLLNLRLELGEEIGRKAQRGSVVFARPAGRNGSGRPKSERLGQVELDLLVEREAGFERAPRRARLGDAP